MSIARCRPARRCPVCPRRLSCYHGRALLEILEVQAGHTRSELRDERAGSPRRGRCGTRPPGIATCLRIGGAGERVKQRALRRRHELVAVAVIAEAQPGVARRLAGAVEHAGGASAVLACEAFVVGNPGTHDPTGAHGPGFRERARRIVAQPLVAHVRGLTPQPGRVQRLPEVRRRCGPTDRRLRLR